VSAVLVTRPADQAVGLNQSLRVAGFTPVHAPLLDITPLALDACMRQQILDLDLYDILISVSANASRLALVHIDLYWPQLPFGQICCAVGESSAAALRHAGMHVIVPTQHDSEGLLALDELNGVLGKRILILRGDGGRETLAQGLRARGARVEYLNLYVRSAVPYGSGVLADLIRQQAVASVLLTSGESCELFARQLADMALLQQLTLIVPSKRVQDVAFAAGASHVLVSDGADDQALINCLRKWKETPCD
jgi:uroporphyrinogen-III synthase